MLDKIKFGHSPRFDERSRLFNISSILDPEKEPRSYTWRCDLRLNQGSMPACTGFMICHEAAARPVVVQGITYEIAVIVYNRAQELDQYEGEDYEGSSVLGAVKAAQERGWIKEYRWAFNEYDLRLAVGYKGPAGIGIPWYEGMMTPTKGGLIKPTGRMVGRHAIMVKGYNVMKDLYKLHNSWGTSWGVNGDCYISSSDLAWLLRDQGEACIPLVRGYGEK